MAATSMRLWALFVVISGGLSGCENVPNPFASNENSAETPIATDASRSVRLVDRDVETPEVFQATDTALWDGRPSLGGVWVASPDAVNPERVIIRNEANGKFVIGALFRRERDNPGPKLQISSDAADALGMLAGQPGQVNVTALRREDNKAEMADIASPATATLAPDVASGAKSAETADSGAAPIAAIAAAGAAIDRVEGVAPVESGDAAAIAAAPLDDLDPTPREGETKRAARKRARLAARAATEAEAADPAPGADIVLDAPLAAAPNVEVEPLPDAAAPAIATPASGSARVQIGIFSVEANAKRAADTLKEGGVDADLRREESNGKVFWSVIANGDGDSKALLAKVKGLGFTDAYAVSG